MTVATGFGGEFLIFAVALCTAVPILGTLTAMRSTMREPWPRHRTRVAGESWRRPTRS